MRVELPPGCAGLDAPGGRVLRPKERGGAVEVGSGAFGQLAAAALGKASQAIGFQGAQTPAIICSGCGFHRFAFSDRPRCPRCGKEES